MAMPNMAGKAPRWYVDEDDSSVERYWNGSQWQSETRPVREGTPRVDDEASAPRRTRASSRPPRLSDYEQEMLAIAEAQLVAQRRSANYLAILTYITVVLLVLSIAAGIIGAIAVARSGG